MGKYYDKLEHLMLCFFITVIVGILTALCGGGLAGAIWAGAGTAMGAGFGKEFGDSAGGGKFDWYDVLADAIGVLLGVGLLVTAYFAKG